MQGKQNALLSLHVGIDIGSTTAKIAAIDAASHELLFSRYVRHHARQADFAAQLLEELGRAFPEASVDAMVTGSGGTTISRLAGVPYIQEVVANSIAIDAYHSRARCAIELGGQDAKMIFFTGEEETGQHSVADMRMNGSCAGGTGAFLDEVATVLNIAPEELDGMASRGTSLHSISGRCGVYAKTDIQPLLNQGVPKEDVALSTMHAVAKQTIGGLAQGIDIVPPVIFEGGPLNFNPTLVRVFAERLNLGEDDIIKPEHPEIIVALGAALAVDAFPTNDPTHVNIEEAVRALHDYDPASDANAAKAAPLFASDAERLVFEERHALPKMEPPALKPGDKLRVYLGIDSGSTTTKLVLVDEGGKPVDSFYASNEGEPLDVAKTALLNLRDKYRAQGVELEVIGAGSTGYGELMFHEAFNLDYHVVETVAHAHAAQSVLPDASFVLDIGGQDMKAIWMDRGVITDILMNEACSSGCGSFLENFANALNIPLERIAPMAFDSKSPAVLGSRCTVFMNSSIVTEQRNGKTPEDIMAGLCTSIIENVFTKVIRASNVEKLGPRIVVQGGTFANDAVLRAFELYVGKEVTRAPYPGLMGAIGVALLTKEHMEQKAAESEGPAGDASPCSSNGSLCETVRRTVSVAAQPARGEASPAGPSTPTPQRRTTSFIGLDALDSFSYTQETNLICPFCTNSCNRTLVAFAHGGSWVTGNRCPKGEVVGSLKDAEVRERVKAASKQLDEVPDLFAVRKELLFRNWEHERLAPARNTTIGLPRVLAIWDTAPFWRTFFSSLGFDVEFSSPSTREMYEEGLSSVTSDTICFPAKLVHGHVRDLAKRGVDRIFMPIITTVEPEGTAETAESMCAVVKGYPMVMRASDNPAERLDVPFDTPLFHWYSNTDRDKQLPRYMREEYGIDEKTALAAIRQADAAQRRFREELQKEGAAVIAQAEREGSFAVVLASRPYQNDDLVNHDLPRLFAEQGVAVLSVDSVPGIFDVKLDRCLLDIGNNYHARMLSGAIIAAEHPNLEYAQVVSFGCGHDAYLSDEIIRLMREVSDSAPLILKVDESSIEGPLRIRVRSFVETLAIRRRLGRVSAARPLADPYPVKFTKRDAAVRTVLVPNTSHAFSRMMAAAFSKQGIKAEPLPIGREEAIRLGKKYVHNDICFPAQIVIGEALEALSSGKYDLDRTAIGMAKYIGDCRLTHYTALLRKALDEAGFSQVPIITNDDVDSHDIHPGFRMNLASAMRIAFALPMIDALEELVRKIRPYEKVPGSANAAFERAMDELIEGLERGGIAGMTKGFKRSVAIMREVEYDRSSPRPTVLIVGEYLLNFHPGANHDIEDYLERNGFEIIEARMTDVIRKTYFYRHAQNKEYGIDKPLSYKATYALDDHFFDLAHDNCDRIAVQHPLYAPATRMQDLVKASDEIVHHTFDAGEGVLIPGEILHHAAHGCRAFVILQPFGCLPNHVVGRGIAKSLKARYPDAQILPLDYDPDVSFANVENRLQMLIMNARAHVGENSGGEGGENEGEQPGGRTGEGASEGPGGRTTGRAVERGKSAEASLAAGER